MGSLEGSAGGFGIFSIGYEMDIVYEPSYLYRKARAPAAFDKGPVKE